MKWNWGTKLFIATAAFMVMLIIFAVLMMKERISLVEKDYYPKGQDYQQLIDKKNNANSLSDQILVNVNGNELVLQFPKQLNTDSISGNIQLYNVVDDIFDKYVILEVDSGGQMRIPIDLSKGRYLMKMDWKHHESLYYTEKSFQIK